MIEATPRPWKWHHRSEDHAHDGSIYSERRTGHAYAVAMMPRYQERKRWAEDAALIVRAVNNHDDLVAALTWAERALAPFSTEPAEKSGMALIRAAIANAKD